MIQRHHDGTNTVQVTFQVPADAAQRADLLGEFNDWTPQPMDRRDDAFAATVDLEAGRRYRFRYLLDGVRWENDWAADAYVPNEYGGDDSLIDLTGDLPADKVETTSDDLLSLTDADPPADASMGATEPPPVSGGGGQGDRKPRAGE